MASLMTNIIKRDVSRKVANLMSSATLVILLEKDAGTMAALKISEGDAYLQPLSPLGIGSSLVKIASNCALHLLRGNLGPGVGSY